MQGVSSGWGSSDNLYPASAKRTAGGWSLPQRLISWKLFSIYKYIGRDLLNLLLERDARPSCSKVASWRAPSGRRRICPCRAMADHSASAMGTCCWRFGGCWAYGRMLSLHTFTTRARGRIDPVDSIVRHWWRLRASRWCRWTRCGMASSWDGR